MYLDGDFWEKLISKSIKDFMSASSAVKELYGIHYTLLSLFKPGRTKKKKKWCKNNYHSFISETKLV